MLCAHYRMPIPSGSEIRRLSGTNVNGASLEGAKYCLEQIGFWADAGSCSITDICRMRCPAIAVVTNDDGSFHYVVVNGLRSRRIELLDPAVGSKKRMNEKEFQRIWTGVILLATPKQKFDSAGFECQLNPSSLLLQTIGRERGSIIVAAISALVQAAMSILGLLLLRQFIDGVANGVTKQTLLGLLAGIFICVGFRALFFAFYDRLKTNFQNRARLLLELEASEHAQRMSTDVLERTNPADVVQRTTNDAAKIASACGSAVDGLVQPLNTALLISVVWWLDSRLGAFALVLTLIYPVLANYSHKRLRKIELSAKSSRDGLRKFFTETLSGAQAIRQAQLTEQRVHELRLLQLESYRTETELERRKTASNTIALFAAGVVTTLTLWLGSLSATQGILAYDQIIFVLIFVNMILGSLRRVSDLIAQLPEHRYAARRHLDLLSENCEPASYAASNVKSIRCTELFFDHVSCQSEDGQRETLDKVTFKLVAGSSALFVDENGSGMEALAKLMSGTHHPSDGKICVDGVDIRDLNLQVRNGLVSLVPSKPFIFQLPLDENICMGLHANSESELVRIVGRVGLDEFVQNLPNRFQTIIGRQGMFTTWCERYQIALARALVQDSKIIIIELPNMPLPETLIATINDLMRSEWAERIVAVLANQPLPNICVDDRYTLDTHCRIIKS